MTLSLAVATSILYGRTLDTRGVPDLVRPILELSFLNGFYVDSLAKRGYARSA